MDLQATLPLLLPKTIAWVEHEAQSAAATGQALSDSAQDLARRVEVARPELIRIVYVDALPLPDDPLLQAAAMQAGVLGPHMAGLTLGYAVFIRHGHDTQRLLSHEFRHVYQYEQLGSIAAFLSVYMQQVVDVGYANAPLEVDARNHEQIAP